MSDNSTGNNAPIYGLGSLTGGLAGTPLTATAIQQQYHQLAQNIYPTTTWASTGTITTYQSPLPLTPETAKDLMAQLEHDKVLVADHKLLFGQYMGKSLREVPLEYIVQLGAAMRGARIQVAKELRRRRALERLTAK